MIIQTSGAGRIGHRLNRLAGGVDLDDSLMVSKVETELAGVGCGALIAVNQLVAILTGAFETAFHVGARLIAESPLLALVPIRTCPIIRCGKDLAFGADADAAFGRWPALMGTADAGTKMVGAFNFFVGQVGAIAVSIAEFRPLDALRPAGGRSLRAEELVVGASDQRAVGLVGIIGAVGETVASPPVREAKSIVAPELTAVTRREIAINFIGAVGAVGAVVTLAARFQTSLAVGAAELVQVTGRHVGGESASSLVSAISTVEKSVAFLLRRQANSARTFEIFALTAPVAAIRFVGAVDAVHHLIAPLVRR